MIWRRTSNLLLLLFLIFPAPLPANSVPFAEWRTLFSLAHSLMNRVANVRASRGDVSGAERARKIAQKLEGGLALWGGIWSFGWDYLRNYAWRDVISGWPPTEVFRAVSEMNDLLGALSELTRMESDKDKARWLLQNYQRVLGVSRSLLRRLLLVFYQSGPLREVVLILQQEAEGGLVRDCLELGASDLKSMLQIAKEIFTSYIYSTPSDTSEDL
ncbi:adenine phosphoribosyltransferase [Tasmannia lanceolata]|uniref:adenine phosphoribosyltransferase n=1 Tax=Tasmannia lanceolata TaxID=3420 RepID=UPI0040648359